MEAQQMETNIQNFYKNKVVFLTGGTGFLGKGVFYYNKKNNNNNENKYY